MDMDIQLWASIVGMVASSTTIGFIFGCLYERNNREE